MKIYLDTANVDEIRQAKATGLLDGVTTNPSHIARSGRGFEEVVREICTIVPEHVSAEAVGESVDELVAEAQRISAWAKQIVIKMPMTEAGVTAAGILEQEKSIRTNVTMVFSPTQAYLAMKAGASYVSIVLSRLDNVGHDSGELVRDTAIIRQQYGFDAEIIAGSVKTQNSMLDCLRAGIDIATIPYSLFKQMFQHPLTDAGLAQFLKDWQSVPR